MVETIYYLLSSKGMESNLLRFDIDGLRDIHILLGTQVFVFQFSFLEVGHVEIYSPFLRIKF